MEFSTKSNKQEHTTDTTKENNYSTYAKFGAAILATVVLPLGLWGKFQAKRVENVATQAGWAEESLHRSGTPIIYERVSAITGVPSTSGIDPKKAKLGCEFYFGKGPVDEELGDVPADLPVVRVVNYQTGVETWDYDSIKPSSIVSRYPECFGNGLADSSDTIKQIAGLAVSDGFTYLNVTNDYEGRERLSVAGLNGCSAYFGFVKQPVTNEPQTYVKIEDKNSPETAVVEANPKTVQETLQANC